MTNRPVGGGSAFGGAPVDRSGRPVAGSGTRSDPYRSPSSPSSGSRSQPTNISGRAPAGGEVPSQRQLDAIRREGLNPDDFVPEQPASVFRGDTRVPVSPAFARRVQTLQDQGEFSRVEQENVARQANLGMASFSDGARAVTPAGAPVGFVSTSDGVRAVFPSGEEVRTPARTVNVLPASESATLVREPTRRERVLERVRQTRVALGDRSPGVQDPLFTNNMVTDSPGGPSTLDGTPFARDGPLRRRPETAAQLRAQAASRPGDPVNVFRFGGALVADDPFRAATTVQVAGLGVGAAAGVAGGAAVRFAPGAVSTVLRGARPVAAAAAPSVAAGTLITPTGQRLVGEGLVATPGFVVGAGAGFRSVVPRERVVGATVTDTQLLSGSSGARGVSGVRQVRGSGFSDTVPGGATQTGVLTVQTQRGFFGTTTQQVPFASNVAFLAQPTVAQTGFRVTAGGVTPRFGQPTSFASGRGLWPAQLERVTLAELPSGAQFAQQQSMRGFFDPRTGATVLAQGSRGGVVLAAVPQRPITIARDEAGFELFRSDVAFTTGTQGWFGGVGDVRRGRSVGVSDVLEFRRGGFSPSVPRVSRLDDFGGVELGVGGFVRQRGVVQVVDTRFVSASEPLAVATARPSVTPNIPSFSSRRAQFGGLQLQSPVSVTRPVPRSVVSGRTPQRFVPSDLIATAPTLRVPTPRSSLLSGTGLLSGTVAGSALVSGTALRGASALQSGQRLFLDTGLRADSALRSGSDLISSSALRFDSALRSDTGLRSDSALRTSAPLRPPGLITGFPPTTPPPPIVPPVGNIPNFGMAPSRGGRGRSQSRGFEYAPSLGGAGITTDDPLRVLTGLEVRPTVRRRRR